MLHQLVRLSSTLRPDVVIMIMMMMLITIIITAMGGEVPLEAPSVVLTDGSLDIIMVVFLTLSSVGLNICKLSDLPANCPGVGRV